MLLLDITVVNTALPSIATGIGAGFNALQWVVDAFTLGLAAVVLTAGSLADRLGRRAVFAAGLALFSLFRTGLNTILPLGAQVALAGAAIALWLVREREIEHEHEIEPEPRAPSKSAPAGPAEVALQPVAP
jgi:MFS family permease